MSKTKRRSPRNTVRTLKGIAELIRAEFGIPCDRMKIKNWQTRHTPPFPTPGENNEFDVELCFEWVKQLQARKGAKGVKSEGNEQLELLERKAEESRLKSKIIDEEERQFEFDKKRGKYVEKDIAISAVGRALSTYHAIVKQVLLRSHTPDKCKELITEIENHAERVSQEGLSVVEDYEKEKGNAS